MGTGPVSVPAQPPLPLPAPGLQAPARSALIPPSSLAPAALRTQLHVLPAFYSGPLSLWMEGQRNEDSDSLLFTLSAGSLRLVTVFLLFD